MQRLQPLRSRLPFLLLGLIGALAASCGSSGISPGSSQNPGDILEDPTGRLFVADVNQSGGGIEFGLTELFWGRLVDVHQLMDDSAVMPQVVDPTPLFVDFVIAEGITTDGVDYLLETNPITLRTRLVILARRDSADPMETARFDDLLRQADMGHAPVEPKGDGPSVPEPFPFVARNACLVLRFDDLMDDDAAALAALPDMVRVLVGLPPTQLFDGRIFFDPNHGGVVGGTYHSTRVLIDFSVSVAESEQFGGLPNVVGLPASSTASGRPNVSIRIPTMISFGGGQFRVLTNLAGTPLDPILNEPNDLLTVTRDVVRAMRAGNENDVSNGYLADGVAPEVVGAFPVNFDAIVDDPAGEPALDFLATITFQTACEATPQVGDLFEVDGMTLEITQAGTPPMGGTVANVPCRASEPVPGGIVLGGPGDFLTCFDPALLDAMAGITEECWLGFAPEPVTLPAAQVNPSSQVVLRFSEPMDPASLSPFEGFQVVEGIDPGNEDPAAPDELVVGLVQKGPNLGRFTFTPVVPFNHLLGLPEAYHVRLRGATDLAGNPIANVFPFAQFSLDPSAPQRLTGGVSLRFDSTDEIGGPGLDVRGQIFADTIEGVLRPRPVLFDTFEIDLQNPVVSLMTTFPTVGIREPLTQYGAKIQFLWRYADLGINLVDETKYDLDVIGLSWAPLSGVLFSDFLPRFEMRLSHSSTLPDEGTLMNSNFPFGGLGGPGSRFVDNILADPRSPQMTVHPRNLGYRIDPTDSFSSSTGRRLIPFPYEPLANPEVGVPPTFTWRDTSVLTLGAPLSPGIPTSDEADAGVVTMDPANPGMALGIGGLAPGGSVPAIGLPLLVEFRCLPSDQALDLNLMQFASYGGATFNLPAHRAFSRGGIDQFGQEQEVNPDAETMPTGGFNPNSNPPGLPTMFVTDSAVYLGQLDTIIRVSRAHTIWIDMGLPAFYQLPIVDPRPEDQPGGTDVILEFRGADGFTPGGALAVAQDAANIDAYGNLYDPANTVLFRNGDATWTDQIADVDGARFLQIRLSFVNNAATGFTPTLSALGIPVDF